MKEEVSFGIFLFRSEFPSFCMHYHLRFLCGTPAEFSPQVPGLAGSIDANR